MLAINNMPIRWLLPLLVVFFGLTSTGASYWLISYTTHKSLIQQRVDRQRADLVSHQLALEGARVDELAYVRRNIAGLAHYPSLKLAVLLDTKRSVVAATRLASVGRAFDPALVGMSAEQLKSLRGQSTPKVWMSESGLELNGAIEICRVVDAQLDAPLDCSLLLLQEDLRDTVANAGALLQQHFVAGMIGTLLLAILVVALIHRAVVRRLQDIMQTAVEFGRGKISARVPVNGVDELAAIGRAINLMLDRVIATQRRLQNRQAHLSALFNENSEGLIVINRHGIVSDFNQRAAEIFGYSASQIIGQNVSVLMPDEAASRHDTFIDHYLDTRQPKIIGRTPLETEGKHRDGRRIPIRINLSEVRSTEELVFIGAVTDLTEWRGLEVQAQRAQKMEAVGALTGGVAHDFNNLLGIIIGNLDMLRRLVNDDPRLLKRIEKAIGAATRGAALTSKLLNFSRQRPEHAEPVSLATAFDGIEELLEHSLTSRIELSVTLSPELPMILVDSGSLQDALVNLILNARDAMPEGGRIDVLATHETLSGHVAGQVTIGDPRGDFV